MAIPKFKSFINTIRFYNTWHLAFLEYFHLLKKEVVIHKLRDGNSFYVRPNKADFDVINEMYLGKREESVLKNISEKSVVIDIGAHIGVPTILAAKIAKKGKVYSYEPVQENYDLLIKNLKLNNLSNVFAFKLGVGGKAGSQIIFMDKTNTGGHSIHGIYGKTGEKLKINLITLNDVFLKNKIHSCDLLKIDCEGAEYEIILNASKNILSKIKFIFIELHPPHNFDKALVQKVEKYLKNCNFKTTISYENSTLIAKR